MRITIGNTPVPGDIPIPVVFRFNASHGQENQTVGVWTQLVNDQGRIYYAYVPDDILLDRGIFGAMHFGFITSNASQKVPNTGSGKQDTYVPKVCYVLEDGTQYTQDDFVSFATSVGGSFNLPPYFRLASKDASSVLVNSNGSLATYTASLAELGELSTDASALAPGVTSFTVLMDRDRARVFAGGAGSYSYCRPILWLDRFGRSIKFSYGTYTTGLPSGISNVQTVTALNGRGKGVQLQWAEPTAGASAPAQVLARLDYIGVQAPSVQVTGYSGVPSYVPAGLGGLSLAMNPIAYGPVIRPLSVTFGNPAGLATPAWMQLPLPSSSAFTEPWPADRTWSYVYDSAQAELTSFTEPSGVVTTLTWQTNSLINTVLSSADNIYRSVKTASSTDGNGTTLTQTWTWTMPKAGGPATWVTKTSGVWSGTNVVAASTPTRSYTFYPPGDIKFGNAVPSDISIQNASGNVLSSSTTTYVSVGLDSSLSAWSGQTVTLQGSPTINSSANSDGVTGLPLLTSRTSGNFAETLTYTYDPHSDLLEPKRLSTRNTQYTVGSTIFAAPEAKCEYDPSSWFPAKSYLDGGLDGQMGTTTTYVMGRAKIKGNFASAPLSISAGLATQDITRDPDSGLASQVVTNFDVPSSTDSFTVQFQAYDTADRPTLTKDGLGLNTSYTYDARGRILSMLKDGQATVTYTYPSETRMTATQNLLTTTTTTDGFGRVLSRSRGSDGVTESYAYDANGNLVSMTETNTASVSRGWSRTYDLLGRLVTSVPAVGPTASYTYTANAGNQVVTTTFTPSQGAPFGTVTNTDLWGRVTSSTDPLGTVTTYTYDAQNHPLTVTTSSAAPTQTRTFTYTKLGLLKTKTEPETAMTTFSNFNAMGKPQVITQAGGRALTYTYDGLGRTRSLTNGPDQTTWTFSGPILNQSTSIVNGTTTTLAYGYDAYKRLVSETATLPGMGVSSWALGYGYDAIGRLTQVNYPVSNRSINYYYDPSNYGRVTQILNGSSLVAAVNYDNWGNRKELIFGSGAFNRWTMTANGLQLTSQSISQYGLAGITRNYAYDGLNHLTQGGEWSNLTHDVLGRLTNATLSQNTGIQLTTSDGPLSYQYDGYGNNSSSTGGAEAALNNFTVAVPSATNQMPGSGTGNQVTGWSYYGNGEASELARAIGAAHLYPHWDGLGRMKDTGNLAESFSYLPTGLRANLTDHDDWTKNRIYAYNSVGQLLTEFRQTVASPATFTTRDVVYFGGQAIAEIDASGAVHELHSDHLGSPIMVTNRSTGQAEGLQFYGAYGETLLSTGSYVPTTGFTGHVQTDPTGLIYMRGRFYSPAWHRFLNSDQGADPFQLNQYAYAGGNPMMVTDPTGMAGDDGKILTPKTNPTDWTLGTSLEVRPGFGYIGTSFRDGFTTSYGSNVTGVGLMMQGDPSRTQIGGLTTVSYGDGRTEYQNFTWTAQTNLAQAWQGWGSDFQYAGTTSTGTPILGYLAGGPSPSNWDLFKEGYSNASVGGYDSPVLDDAVGIASGAAGGLATGAAARWGLGAAIGGPGSLAAQNSAALGGLTTPLGWGLMLSVPIGKAIAGFGNIYFNRLYKP